MAAVVEGGVRGGGRHARAFMRILAYIAGVAVRPPARQKRGQASPCKAVRPGGRWRGASGQSGRPRGIVAVQPKCIRVLTVNGEQLLVSTWAGNQGATARPFSTYSGLAGSRTAAKLPVRLALKAADQSVDASQG
jgi:hypothetical protein